MGLIYSPVLGRPQALEMGDPVTEPRVAEGCVKLDSYMPPNNGSVLGNVSLGSFITGQAPRVHMLHSWAVGYCLWCPGCKPKQRVTAQNSRKFH